MGDSILKKYPVSSVSLISCSYDTEEFQRGKFVAKRSCLNSDMYFTNFRMTMM
jgi:hypothetical protein